MSKFCPECGAAKGRTIVNYILDESTSMRSCKEAAISGFNEYVGDLRKDGGDILLSLTKFQNSVNVVHTLAKLDDVPDLTEQTYVPGGMTALFDAIGHTISAIEKDVQPNDKVLCVIMTDGEENQSREFSREQVNKLITEKEKLGNWTFVYLGANQDAFANATALGIQVNNTLNYASTNHGHQHAMRRVRGATLAYAADASLRATNDFFAGTVDDEIPPHTHTISKADTSLIASP